MDYLKDSEGISLHIFIFVHIIQGTMHKCSKNGVAFNLYLRGPIPQTFTDPIFSTQDPKMLHLPVMHIAEPLLASWVLYWERHYEGCYVIFKFGLSLEKQYNNFPHQLKHLDV